MWGRRLGIRRRIWWRMWVNWQACFIEMWVYTNGMAPRSAQTGFHEGRLELMQTLRDSWTCLTSGWDIRSLVFVQTPRTYDRQKISWLPKHLYHMFRIWQLSHQPMRSDRVSFNGYILLRIAHWEQVMMSLTKHAGTSSKQRSTNTFKQYSHSARDLRNVRALIHATINWYLQTLFAQYSHLTLYQNIQGILQGRVLNWAPESMTFPLRFKDQENDVIWDLGY